MPDELCSQERPAPPGEAGEAAAAITALPGSMEEEAPAAVWGPGPGTTAQSHRQGLLHWTRGMEGLLLRLLMQGLMIVTLSCLGELRSSPPGAQCEGIGYHLAAGDLSP